MKKLKTKKEDAQKKRSSTFNLLINITINLPLVTVTTIPFPMSHSEPVVLRESPNLHWDGTIAAGTATVLMLQLYDHGTAYNAVV